MKELGKSEFEIGIEIRRIRRIIGTKIQDLRRGTRAKTIPELFNSKC